MVDFKKDTWLYAIIAAILAAISIFTPVASVSDLYIFFSGSIGYDTGTEEWGGYGTATIWTLGLTMMCITLLLTVGINTWRGKEFKWDWLIYLLTGIGMIIFPILMLVYDLDHPLLGTLDVGFAGIGILIAGIIAVVAFVMDKFLGGE